MITATVADAALTAGETAGLTICFTNAGPGTCTDVIFTLSVPGDVLLLQSARARLDLLGPGETRALSFRVRPRAAGPFQVRSKNFSYRDQYGASRRINDFHAEVRAEPERTAAGPRITAQQVSFELEFITQSLRFGEWGTLEGRITNSGVIDLADLRISISSTPLIIDELWRPGSLGTVPPGGSAGFRFPVCASRDGGDLPVHLDISCASQPGRITQKITKTIRVDRGMPPSHSGPMLILFIGANPVTSEPLRIGKEYSVIIQAAETGRFGGRLDVRSCLAAQAGTISDHLLNLRPQIVHFAGHGGDADEGFVAEYDDGTAHLIAGDALAEPFKASRKSVDCVVINACSSAGLAAAVAGHVGCVIAMTQSIIDDHAIAFSSGFYQALAAGEDVRGAFGWGRARLMMAGGDGDDVRWYQAPSPDPAEAAPSG